MLAAWHVAILTAWVGPSCKVRDTLSTSALRSFGGQRSNNVRCVTVDDELSSIKLKLPLEDLVAPLEEEDAAPDLEADAPTQPPPRSITYGGYIAPPEKVTWKPFRYALPAVRRAAVRNYTVGRDGALPPLPSLKLVLIGGVASGKGTLAPMLSQAFRARVIGIGQLLRGEVRAGKPRGLQAAERMAEGALLEDELVLEMLDERLSPNGRSSDIERNGWLLDGFPRTRRQAEAILSDEWPALRPDCVVLIERPEELAKEFSLGRCCDSTTGQTYHPVYAPAPEEVHDRLVWRVDDTTDVLQRRCEEHRRSCAGIVSAFEASGVPLRRFDNARSELETFADIAQFIEGVASQKLADRRDLLLAEQRAQQAASASSSSRRPRGAAVDLRPSLELMSQAAAALAPGVSDLREDDVGMLCEPGEDDAACVLRFNDEVREEDASNTLLAAVRRCNEYDPTEYLPVLVGDDQVGWVNEATLDALTSQLAAGIACELVDLGRTDSSIGAAMAAGTAIRLAPAAESTAVRTAVMASVVDELVADGHIPAAKVRNELQDVHPLSRGFVSDMTTAPPLRLERAAMIYFGVPSYGVHVNGWVRDPDDPSNARPWGLWIAKRSMSKATYAGLLDQMVAGGQPTGMTFAENVRKECAEEASLPPEVISQIRQTGLVSYRCDGRRWPPTAAAPLAPCPFR